jgi:hypothetical protein
MTAVRSRALLPLAALGLCALALAGCETTGTGPGPMAAAAPQPPMDHARAAEECWMGTEKSDAHMDLDKRADIVDRCIKDKMKGAGPAPRT